MDLPKRKPTRLRNYDYNRNGYYFITICTHNKENLLCHIVGEGLCALPSVKLTAIGKTVDNAIRYINGRYTDIKIVKYVIMPNHIHFILSKQAGGLGGPPLHIYDIIGRFKSFTSNQYHAVLWQRSFHDHIIRGEKDYLKIWNYIDMNPQKWNKDCFYVE